MTAAAMDVDATSTTPATTAREMNTPPSALAVVRANAARDDDDDATDATMARLIFYY